MKTRFDKAVMKLYTAFHEGTLDAMNCEHCAVGNLCDNSSEWAKNSLYDREINAEQFNTGYSNEELLLIEQKFIFGAKLGETPLFENRAIYDDGKLIIGGREISQEEQKDLQFKGLCEVVKYLAELDGVENPMEIMHLFKNKELVL